MPAFGLNHMTVPHRAAEETLRLAAELGCAGVEFRNDLAAPLFDGTTPEQIGERAKAAGLRIFALAEVKAFNAPDADPRDAARALAMTAKACGAEGIALIPQVLDRPIPRSEQVDALRRALELLRPVLEESGVQGLIEPLGFAGASLRFKADVVNVLDDMGRPDCFRLVHDTFHHALAATDSYAPELTALVHISGVADPLPALADLTDAHRGLVGPTDRLDNIAQLRVLDAAGCTAALSFEAFAPETQSLSDPASALAGSIAFISEAMKAQAA